MTVFTREEVYTQPPEKRKILWFIYYEFVDGVANGILILGLLTLWEIGLRNIFLQ